MRVRYIILKNNFLERNALDVVMNSLYLEEGIVAYSTGKIP